MLRNPNIPATKCTPDDVKVIYQGSKTLWRQRITFDIYIVHHKSSQALELIFFSPHESTEPPRIYIPYTSLLNRLDAETLKEKIHLRKDFHMRKGKPVDEASITVEVTEDMIVHYLLPKVNMKDRSTNLHFEIYLNEEWDDQAHSGLTFEKPDKLQPLQINHSTPAS